MSTSESSIKNAPKSHPLLPWLVWGLGCAFYFYECLLQFSPSVMSHELMHDFGITSKALGFMAGFYFWSYALNQLPAGVLLDYFGPRRLLTTATLICAVSTIAFGLTENFYMACISRLMIGFGSAFAAVGTMKLAANWFPASRFALLTGMMVTIGMLGAIGGEAPLALLLEVSGWRHSLIILGGIGLFLAALIFIVAKDEPQEGPVEQHHDDVEQLGVIDGLKALVSNVQLWLVAIYGGLMFMWTPVFCGLWGVPFIEAKFGVDKAIAGSDVSLVLIGWAVASPLWGIFSNRIGRRKTPMYIGSVGALICSTLFLYAPGISHLQLQILLLGFGLFSAGFLPSFAVARELCQPRQVATGLSFMNMMNMIGIAIAQPLIGVILDGVEKQNLGEEHIYTLASYHSALSILPIGIILSLLILPKIKETYCQSVH